MKTQFPLFCMLCAMAAPALAQSPPPSSAPHKPVPLDAVEADMDAGYYQLGPGRAVRYWREGDHFYFGAVGTTKRSEALYEGANRFFMANGVTFTFNRGTDDAVASLTVNQGGRDIAAPRITESAAQSLAPPPPAPVAARTWPVLPGVTIRNLTVQAGASMDYWPCFSPDGKTILFSRTLDNGKTWSLMTIPATGGPVKPFAVLPVSATRASWSPVSNRIVFNGDGPGQSPLWI